MDILLAKRQSERAAENVRIGWFHSTSDLLLYMLYHSMIICKSD